MAEINPLYPITELTQSQYDALNVKDAHTLYAIPFDSVTPSRQRPDSGNTLPCLLITQAEYDALGTYDVNTLYCIGQPKPVYDDTKIAVVLLDENHQKTQYVNYYSTVAEASSFLKSQAAQGKLFFLTVGARCNVPTLAYKAFADCKTLYSADFSNGYLGQTSSVGKQAFIRCTSLKSIVLPPLMGWYLDDYTFYACSSLEDVEIPSTNVLYINTGAFRLCSSLKSITIPSCVTSIASTAFTDCSSLTSITVEKPQGSISGAPWGATNSQIIWTG